MAEKEFGLEVNRRESRPRSKRLRELGGGSTGGGSTVVQVANGTQKGDGHTHDNKAVLDMLDADDQSYVYLRQQGAGGGQMPQLEKAKAGYADEAGVAKDLTADSPVRKQFLSRVHEDSAEALIRLLAGLEVGAYEPGTEGGAIDANGRAEVLSAVVRQLLRSARFRDGIGGEGWQLWIDEEELSNLTIDRLTVRRVMTVFELLVDKIRSVGGQLVVSAANGKIKTVEEADDRYVISFETENTFMPHDLMRCQTFTGGELKSYWVEVARATIDGNSIEVAKSEFEGTVPAEGDECVLMGNTTNAKRQNLILISATEDGEPRIDVMDGVRAKHFSGCLRARLGNLDGISDSWFGADHQPHGNGLYSDNAYLRGTFVLETGENVKTAFEIMEGKIASAVSALRQDIVQDEGYLSNPCFDEGLSKWVTENEAVFWLAGNRWIWANRNVLTKKGAGASVTMDDGRVVVRIRNKYIRQPNSNLRSIPTMTTNSRGNKEAKPVYLSFLYRCAEAGTLGVRFEDVDKTGFEAFDSLDVEEPLTVTNGYQRYNCSGLWNGTGDFKLSFTGDIYVYMLVLSTDKIESLTNEYRTLFEQSEKLVKIAAENFDEDGHVLATSGIMVKGTGTGIYAQGPDGKLALIGVGVEEGDGEGGTRTVIKLTADHMQLEGLVTANQNFKIKEDGSIEARNGTFDGYLRTRMKTVAESDAAAVSVNGTTAYRPGNDLNLCVTGTWIVLPSNADYIGSRVILWNGATPPYTRSTLIGSSSRVTHENGGSIMGLSARVEEANLTEWNDPTWIEWLNGLMELIGVPQDQYDPQTGTTTRTCGWCIIGFSAVYFAYGT